MMLRGRDQAAMLAGYLLANSADHLSYVDEVNVLTPFSIGFKKNQFHPKFHTGKSQAEAVASAKEELTENESKYDAWAFAREGTLEENEQPVHTISVSAWSIGIREPVIFIQRFERAPRFRLIADPFVGVNGVILDMEMSKPIIVILLKGISKHEEGGHKWSAWH